MKTKPITFIIAMLLFVTVASAYNSGTITVPTGGGGGDGTCTTCVLKAGDNMTGPLNMVYASAPTINLNDTTDAGIASWSRTDSAALASHKNTAQEGGIAYGLNYDTNTDTVAINTTALLDGHNGQTWSFWIKTTQNLGTAAYFGILSKFSGTDNQRSYDFRYRDAAAGNNRISVALRDNNLVYNPNTEWIIPDIDDGNWHHIAFTWNYSAGRFNFYLDGSAVANVTNLNTSTTQYAGGTNKAVELGSEKWALSSLLAQYDEWVTWSRELTSGEISDLYNSGNGVYTTTTKTFGSTGNSMGSGLIGLWHMDENTGTTIADTSGNSLTGTFGTTNPAWTTGHIASDGVDYEVTYLTNADGGSGVRTITTLGNSLGNTIINGLNVIFQQGGSQKGLLDSMGNWQFGTNSLFINTTSDSVRIGAVNQTNITNDFVVSGGTGCSYVDAGDSAWSTCSSETIKTNIVSINKPSALTAISKLDPIKYDYIDNEELVFDGYVNQNGDKNDPANWKYRTVKKRDRPVYGLTAEDVHDAFKNDPLYSGNNKTIDWNYVNMQLLAAVIELQAKVAALEAGK